MSRSSRFLPATTQAAARADAGDCFEYARGYTVCLPGVVNIGVQKAGTGELQTWLGVHPEVTVHGGEVHFFDGMDKATTCTARRRARLRLRYAKFLWRRRSLRPEQVRGRLLYEKTPAYFDKASPHLVACAVPSARLLVMLRDPTERARSAYAMCQRESESAWCRLPFDEALARILLLPRGGGSRRRSSRNLEADPGTTSTSNGNGTGAAAAANAIIWPIAPRPNRHALKRAPHLRRMLMMGHYAHFLRQWLDAFSATRVRVLWLEQFKRDPFACMQAVESFVGLAAHPYQSLATRNAAGFYVVGKSKSSSASTSLSAADSAKATAAVAVAATPTRSASYAAALAALRRYYAPWQARLATLLVETNTSLLPGANYTR